VATNKQTRLKQEWDKWIVSMKKDDIQKLIDAGFDIGEYSPFPNNLPMVHRGIDTRGGKDSEYSKWNESYFQRITKKDLIRKHIESQIEVESEPEMGFAVYIAAQVISAFDCSRDKQVKIHVDCMKLAIGMPSCKSQKDICKKYNLPKANVSWRVRSIQKRLNLPRNCFNGNRFEK
jgi:hypothetical protein